MRAWRSATGLLGLSVLTLVIVDACAPSIERSMGDVMIDAGTVLAGASGNGNGGASGMGPGGNGETGLLTDAGNILIDAGTALRDSGAEAGSDASAQGANNASGSRIQLRRTVQIGSDGTRYDVPWATYYDTLLNTECVLTRMSDGTTRCAPAYSGLIVGSYFSDAGCTTRLVWRTSNCVSAARFVSETILPTAPTCAEQHTRHYRVGSVFTGTLYGGNSTYCAAVTAPSYTVYSLEAELNPSELVEFTETVESL